MRPLKDSTLPFCIGPHPELVEGARHDVMPLDLHVGAPGQNGIRRELRAVVGDDHRRLAAAGDDGREFAHDAGAGD